MHTVANEVKETNLFKLGRLLDYNSDCFPLGFITALWIWSIRLKNWL